MDPNLFRPSCVFMNMLIISILSHVPMFLCQDNEQYAACGNLFHCANISSIGYPFSGQDRPAYCGHSGFRLSCIGNTPLITIQSEEYRVLEIDNGTQTLKVAREDLLNNLCPTILYNTTIDFNLFSYASNLQNLTLNYTCTGTQAEHQFDCTGNDGTTTINYFSTADTNLSVVTCDDSVLVPISQTSAQVLASPKASVNDLRAVIGRGFQLEWSAKDLSCEQCIQSGGRCGSANSSSTSFACYCTDRPYELTCNKTQIGTGNVELYTNSDSTKAVNKVDLFTFVRGSSHCPAIVVC
ncbi:unnamed protein product [Ilex paraguariensis]|uniref:non-specific serine/threonine protein kinase n=1 Tax=Ilex paraguariensis TaxID=185542 RepID=A0ABC8S0I0_9AQUA